MDNNTKTISIEDEELVLLIKQTFGSGGEFKLLVTGNSMLPFIRHMRDCVILTSPSNRKIDRGEIVFIQRESGKLVLHRAIKMEPGGFIMNGDAQLWKEFVPLNQVFAVVCRIERKGRIISCDQRLYKFLSELWMLFRPFRRLFFRTIGLFVKVCRNIFHNRY